MKRKHNADDRGFSLVELVLTVALLSVVALVISTMLISGTNVYTGVNSEIGLQYRCVNVTAQLQEYFLSCNGICKEDNAVYIADKTDSKLYKLETENGSLTLTQIDIAVNGSAVTSTAHAAVPFCDDVSRFDVTVYEDAGNAQSVRIDLELTKNGRSYPESRLLSFRSPVSYISRAEHGETVYAALLNAVWGTN